MLNVVNVIAELATEPGTASLEKMLWAVVAIVVVALVFDFLNGFHDAANSIATVVSTRVLSPTQAVVWAAVFNFVAAFLFGTGVAATVGKELIKPDIVDIYVVFGGLMGAIAWNIITWLLGLPTSSSHALVSGLAGAAIAKSGFGVLLWGGWWSGWGAIMLFLILSPVIGFILGMFNMTVVAWIFRYATPSWIDKKFRRLQLFSAAIYSLGHGGNDAQKTMGVIVMLLTAAGWGKWAAADPNHWFAALNFHHWMVRWHWVNPPKAGDVDVAWWIVLLCNAAIAMGTMFGGWRIVKTMGSNITKLQPVGGFCAETAAAMTIWYATFTKTPISTTHAITGAILGVGSTKSVKSVRWIWGQRIVVAWVLTIPCSAFMAAVAYGLVQLVVKLIGK